MIRLGVVSNPRSRRNVTGLERIEQVVSRHPDILHTVLDGQVSWSEVFAEFAHREVSVIAVNGGDGTIQRMLTALCLEERAEPRPTIALLSGGTTNLIAADVGFGGGAAEGLERLIAAASAPDAADRTVMRAIMRIDGLADAGPQCGMFLGLGALARVIAYYRDRLSGYRLPGALLVTATAARIIVECLFPRRNGAVVRADAVGIAVDDTAMHREERCLAFVTTLGGIGNRELWWNQSDRPLTFTTVAFPPRQAARAIWLAARGRSGDVLPSTTFASGSADRIAFDASGSVAIDGELFALTPGQPMVVTGLEPLRFFRADP